jgi:SAM-dependent methyltransferase
VGRLLARFNAQLNARAVSRLVIPPSGRALEIGFGPGDGIRRLTERLPEGYVAGIDPSDVMLEQARRRNEPAVGAGRVDLRRGVAAQLPWPDGAFDAVLSVNNFLLWNPRDRCLAEARRVLRPGGTLLVAMHEWAARAHASPGRRGLPWIVEDAVGSISRAGFGSVRSDVIPVRIGRAMIVSAVRPREPESATFDSGDAMTRPEAARTS